MSWIDTPKDIRAPDGKLADGERVVRKGGRVKFAGRWWQSDKLVPFVGTPVQCGGMDYWMTECTFRWIVWPESAGPLPYRPRGQIEKVICTIKDGRTV